MSARKIWDAVRAPDSFRGGRSQRTSMTWRDKERGTVSLFLDPNGVPTSLAIATGVGQINFTDPVDIEGWFQGRFGNNYHVFAEFEKIVGLQLSLRSMMAAAIERDRREKLASQPLRSMLPPQPKKRRARR